MLPILFLFSFIKLGPLTSDSYAYFELNNNLIKSIRAYLCYTCFSWLKPLYTSINKKFSLPVDDDINDKEKYFTEIIILTHQFQQLLNNYMHDIMDLETSNYFKAKKEIKRINQLLTTSSSEVSIGGKCLIICFHFFILMFLLNFTIGTINEELIGCLKSSKSEVENENTEILGSEVITSETNELKYMKSLTENMKECNIDNITDCNKLEQEESNDCCMLIQNKEIHYLQNNNNAITDCDIVCTNDDSTKVHEINNSFENTNDLLVMEREKCKAEIYQFYQNLKTEIDKFNLIEPESPVKYIAHLEIEASKKKELEKIVTEFENKRIDSPNPFSFIAELKTFIHNLEINFKYDTNGIACL